MNYQIAKQQQKAALTVAVATRAREVLEEYGAEAFALPRAAALAHEAGHAVVVAALGLQVEFIKVERVADFGGAWSGFRGHFLRFPDQRRMADDQGQPAP